MNEEARIKHNEAARLWSKNNPEKRKEAYNNYWKRRREKNPELWKAQMREKARLHRLKHLQEYKKKEREYSQKKRDENRDKVNAEQREFRKNNSDKVKQYYLKQRERSKVTARIRLLKKYGLVEESYQKMLIDQAGKCALCNKVIVDAKIDHCHKTGKVRGLVHSYCNTGLGYLEKMIEIRPDFLTIVAEYLKY